MPIHAGDFIEVHGKIRIAPDICNRCGDRDAVHFAPSGGDMVGHCEPCYSYLQARETWSKSLSDSDWERWHQLTDESIEAETQYNGAILAREDRVLGVTRATVREAERHFLRMRGRVARWEQRHGCPCDPRPL